jgi:hypothetical protein
MRDLTMVVSESQQRKQPMRLFLLLLLIALCPRALLRGIGCLVCLVILLFLWCLFFPSATKEPRSQPIVTMEIQK